MNVLLGVPAAKALPSAAEGDAVHKLGSDKYGSALDVGFHVPAHDLPLGSARRHRLAVGAERDRQDRAGRAG